MIEAIAGGYESGKALIGIAKGLSSLKTDTAVAQATIDIQRHVLETQKALDAADRTHADDVKRLEELEKEIARLLDWTGEKDKYQLKAITPRAYAYVVRDGVELSGDPHWICQPCFEASYKSILQWTGKVISPGGIRGMFATWNCSRCKSEIQVGRNQSPVGESDSGSQPAAEKLDYSRNKVV